MFHRNLLSPLAFIQVNKAIIEAASERDIIPFAEDETKALYMLDNHLLSHAPSPSLGDSRHIYNPENYEVLCKTALQFEPNGGGGLTGYCLPCPIHSVNIVRAFLMTATNSKCGDI